MKPDPSANGRDGAGRFVKGNPGGPGNPLASNAQAFRKAIYEAVTLDEMKDVVRVLFRCARTGQPWAVKELLDRTAGKATQYVEGSLDLNVESMLTDEEQKIANRIASRRLGTDTRVN